MSFQSPDDAANSLATVLKALMLRPTYRVTPGLLSKLSGVPRATIVNWLESRVTRPRHFRDVLKIADALRLSDVETDRLLRAAGQPPAAALREADGLQHAVPAEPGRVGTSELPSPLTELIGREREIAEITAACRKPGMRLVTLIGTGGVGKTHLAVAVASKLADDFPGGIVWVPLSAHVDPADLLPAIAIAVGAKESNAASMLRTIVNALHAERILLVLDNLEQLIAGAARLSELLEALPELALLVTSRIALRIRGERVFHVMPLALPPAAGTSTEEVSASPAVSLFATRAAAAGATFSVGENAATIVAICARLDGLPLALELAAAWTRLLSPQALLGRLEHRLRLLTNGARDGAPRHQTLRDTIAWSYGLLSDGQRVLFRRLAVLNGGITVDSATALGNFAGAAADGVTVLDTLSALVEHNLLTVKADPAAAEPRMNMLQTIREYALEMLVEQGEYEEVRRRHAFYFVELAESVDASFTSAPTAVWLARLRSEHENLRAALGWAFEEGGDPSAAARLVTALGRYWFERGLFQEARRWIERARALGVAPDAAVAARICLYAAFVANYEGDYATGAVAARDAFTAYTSEGDVVGCAQARNALGIAALYTGDVDLAEKHFVETLDTQRTLGDKRGIAVALHNLGEVATECRFDLLLAENRFNESLALFSDIGHTLNVATTLGSLGELYAYGRDIPRAIDFALRAIDAYTELENRPLIAEGLTRLARYELFAGDVRRAHELLRRAVEQLRMSFNPPHVASCFEVLASLANEARAPELAAQFLGFSESVRDCYRVPLLRASQQRHDAVVDVTRSQLPAVTFDDLWQRGYVFRPDEAFDASAALLVPHPMRAERERHSAG